MQKGRDAMSRIAVIIPVYEAAGTLPRLIDSLRAQTFGDFTAIFVDDGSSDGSRDLIRSAAKEDTRVVLIESSHGGPGAARNLGLDMADAIQTDFITFLDADDHLVPAALETAIRTLDDSGADIVHYPWSSGTEERPSTHPPVLPSIFVWNKVYRRNAVAGVRFLQSTYAEDLAYFIETEARAPRRVECPRALYVHVKRAGSLWESRAPGDIIHAMDAVSAHLSSFFASRSKLPIAADWRNFYLPGLLKNWRKAVRRLPRWYRERGKRDFLDRVAELHAAGQFPYLRWPEPRFRLRCLLMAASRPVHGVLCGAVDACRSLSYRHRHARLLKRVRSSQAPVKVLFLVSEISKWKTRALFKLMARTSRYSPVIGVGLDDCETHLPAEERKALLERRMKWFQERQYACVPVFDADKCRALELRELHPDLVFYQQPWQIPKQHQPNAVSRFALTFYVPYCMADFGNLEAECLMPFFGQLFAYFVQSGSWASLYRSAAHRRGCRFVASGHPMIDQFRRSDDTAPSQDGSDGCIIYAPHWTFRHPGRNDLYPYGTFNGNGRQILDYAKRHPEWQWVFKPHPLLRAALVEHGLMTKEEADAYYAEWEALGKACYDADYPPLFVASRAMITDSGSFLVEYGATGNPLIHLKPHDSRIRTLPPNRELFESYYSATNLDAMHAAFSMVLERREDPFKERRQAAARKAGLCSFRASDRILNYLDHILQKKTEVLCRD